MSPTTANNHPPFEYLTETPYYSNEDDIVNSTSAVAKTHEEDPNENLAPVHSGKYLTKKKFARISIPLKAIVLFFSCGFKGGSYVHTVVIKTLL